MVRCCCFQQDALKEQGEQFERTLEAKEGRLRTAVEAELKAARKELERSKKSAKFDLVAAEGRTKKLGILEHTVATLRHELQTNVERRPV